MPRFLPCEQPRDSMWGAPQTATQILPGVWEIQTSGHGGMLLSDQRQSAMPKALRLDGPSYEEDVDWALVVLAFDDEFMALPTKGFDLLVDNARASVKAWHPDRYSAYTGEPVEPKDSDVLRRRQAVRAQIGNYVVVSASGDWAGWVPEGKVGVVARRVVRADAMGHAIFQGDPIHGLIERVNYDSSRPVNGFDEIGAVRIEADAPATKEVVL
ncbi:MAG: hypothetical protein EDM03_09255 [Porphyrobacter sp. IPPAS B-1204]|nr:MAG: hypothetical protein EDM03_09255 [Porphyrobacter sp. IPPAS B-1204]